MSLYLDHQYFSIKDFKSIGIFEIIFSIKKYINMISYLSKMIIAKDYDLIITIDSPDFNYPLIKKFEIKNLKKILYILLLQQFGLGENIEQKNLQKFLMKYLFYLILKDLIF